MKYLLLVFALIIALVPTSLTAQQKAHPSAKFISESKSVGIPLDIDNNIIRMKVRINGSRELTMIFDTGASVTGIDEHFVKELGLKTTSDTLKGSGTGGNFTGKYVKTSTISVEGVEVYNQPLAAFKINSPPGFDFDGIIGYDFIKAFVVEIDYEKKTMTLRDPKTYVYRGKGEIVPLNLVGRKTPLVKMTMKVNGRPAFPVNLELDGGFDGAFVLNSPTVKKRNLGSAFKDVVERTNRGAGGDQQLVMVQFALVRFGSIFLDRPPVGLAFDTVRAGAATNNDGIIGGEVLRRFKVIIDYSRQRMIIKRNKAFNEPYVTDDSE
ncbi:MAG: retropepsin-like aspartic protease [Pyrinomonadaceae bacterium]